MNTVNLHYLVIYPVAEFFQLFVLGIYTVYGICYSYAESYYSRNVFCAGTSASFLSASVNKEEGGISCLHKEHRNPSGHVSYDR